MGNYTCRYEQRSPSAVKTDNPHHDSPVDETSSLVVRPQVGILLCGRHGDVPDGLPGSVERRVDGIHSRMVWRDGVVVVKGRDGVSLEGGRGDGKSTE